MTLSHEFRQPLTSTLMLLQTILINSKNEATKETLKIVMTQINLLLCLVNDTLDLKMIE